MLSSHPVYRIAPSILSADFARLGEEVQAKHLSLASIVSQIADSVCVRHNKGRDYGVVVIPEGLASSVPELSILLKEIDTLQRAGADPMAGLSSWSKAVLLSLPDFIQKQLMLQFEAQNFAGHPAAQSHRNGAFAFSVGWSRA